MKAFTGIFAVGAVFSSLVSAAPFIGAEESSIEAIPGKYIIQLKDDVTMEEMDSHISWVQGVHARSVGKRDGSSKGIERKYRIADKFSAYAGSFDDATIAEIKKNPNVVAVENDQIWRLTFIEGSEITPNEAHVAKRGLQTQMNSTWGLGAISHKSGKAMEYAYDDKAGEGAFAYVVDSGSNTANVEFENRGIQGFSAVTGAPTMDTVGHGTHVAGTIAGKTYGIAKKAKVVPVKVFAGSSGSNADVMKGFEWAANDIIQNKRMTKAAINMSLGGGFSKVFNDAVNAAYEKGVMVVVAAGNDHKDAKGASPASAENAFTVGAIDINLNEATYSNFGTILDLYAPGTNVLSAWMGNPTATKAISGTSMASPHTCGTALYLMTVKNSGDSKGTTAMLKQLANNNLLKGISAGSPNKLAYNGSGK